MSKFSQEIAQLKACNFNRIIENQEVVSGYVYKLQDGINFINRIIDHNRELLECAQRAEDLVDKMECELNKSTPFA